MSKRIGLLFRKMFSLVCWLMLLDGMTFGALSGCQRRADMTKLLQYAKAGDESSLRGELSKGFDANQLNSLDGHLDTTPLHVAAEGGHVGIIKAFIDSGVHADLKLTDGSTPLVLATLAGKTDAANRLLLDGANPNIEPTGPLSGAVPLIAALLQKYDDLARGLVTHGANVNIETVGSANGNRLTPLIVASLNGDLEMAKFLVSHGANVNQMAGVMTPINGAVQSGNEDVVKFLLVAGARPMFVDAEMADNEHHPAMARMLRAADPVNQLLKRSAALKAEWNQLRQELAAFLLNAQQTGVLDKQKLAAYQTQLEELEKQMQAVVGEKP